MPQGSNPIVERRALLLVGGASAVILGGGCAHTAVSGDPSYSAFLKQGAADLAAMLPAAGPAEQDAYIYSAAMKLRAVTDVPFPTGMKNTGVDIQPMDKAKVFGLVAYQAAPGALFPPHDHPGYGVATMGLEGAVRVRTFDFDGTPPAHAAKDVFRVRKTSERWLRSRDVMTLTPSRDNMHMFEAGPDGARWIDVNTELVANAGDFSYMRLSPTAGERSGEIYEARWGLKD